MSLLTASLLAFTPSPLALAPTATPLAPQDQEELLGIYITEGDVLLRHAKDRGLAAALSLVDDRVAELPNEIPGFDMPPGALPILSRLLSGRKTLRIVRDNQAEVIPIAAELAMLEAEAGSAQRINTQIRDLLAAMGAPLEAPDANGMTLVPVPAPMPVAFGPVGNAMKLVVGNPIAGPMNLRGASLPGGLAPDMVMHLDYGGMLGLGMEFLAMQAPDEMEQLDLMFNSLGLDQLDIHMAYGADAERSYTVTSMPGYVASQRDTGMLPARALTANDLRLVPADASWAAVGVANLQGTFDMMMALMEEMGAEQGMGDPVEMIAQMTGINLETDLINHLGSSMGLYASDTTGGGGLASVVMFLEIKSREGLMPLVERLTGMINGLGQSEANGYVQVRPWERGGQQFFTLTFPGIPVPLEPTVAITDHHMFVGLSPNAAVAAVAQSGGSGAGLMENAAFREQMPGQLEGAYSVSFFDNARLMRDGYGPTSLLCSALRNAVRSPVDASREAGPIMPPYHELVAGVKASVGVARFVGDDYVNVMHGDPSVLVNATGMVGFLSSSPLLAIVPLAAIGFATEQRQSEMMMQEWEAIDEATPDRDF